MCPQAEDSHFACCSLSLSGREVGLALLALGSSHADGHCLPSGAQGLSEGLTEFGVSSTSPCCTGEVLGQGAASSVLVLQSLAFCVGLVTRPGQKHQVPRSPRGVSCGTCFG